MDTARRSTIPLLATTGVAVSAVADRLVNDHLDDPNWLDALGEALDRRRSGSAIERIMSVWDLSRAELGEMHGVSRQAVTKWIGRGVPGERAVAMADLSAATDLLVHYVKRDRIPAVVRRPAPKLGGQSLVDLVACGEHAAVLDVCRAMFDVATVPA